MTNEQLFYSLNDVDEGFIAEAAPGRRAKRGWVKWAAAAACLCLIAGGTFALSRGGEAPTAVSDELPMIAVPEFRIDGMGFEGLMYYSADEMENGNPWTEDMNITALPVYRSGVYDTSGAGVPRGLNTAEMTERLEAAAAALGLEILEKQPVTDYWLTGNEDETMIQDEVVTLVKAITDAGTLWALADGTVTYWLPENFALPAEYHFTYTGTTDADAEAAMEYLAKTYAAFLDFEQPEIVLSGEYNIYGEYTRSYRVYDAAGDDTEDILNYAFRSARFAPDDDGNLMLVSVGDGLLNAEKLGDYPLISVAEATEKLAAGEYQTSVPVAMPGTEYIAKVELVYRAGRLEETLLPYYRFHVELQDADGWQMMRENGLKTYGAYYVPAVQDQYISWLPTYDGRFN